MGKHGPNRLCDYRRTHDTVIEQFISQGFVTADGCAFTELGNGVLLLSGTVECLGGLFYVDVSKLLAILDGEGPNARVKTVAYSYNAVWRGRGVVWRYDSPHDHRQFHHVHRHDVLGAEPQRETIAEVDSNTWPTLGEAIAELRDWYYANYDAIEAIRIAQECDTSTS